MTGMLTEFNLKPITPGQWLWIDCPGPLDGAVGLVEAVPNKNRVDLLVPAAKGGREVTVKVTTLASVLVTHGTHGDVTMIRIRLRDAGLPAWPRPSDLVLDEPGGKLRTALARQEALQENQDASRWLASGATRPLSRLDDDRAVKIELDGVMRLREFRLKNNIWWDLVGEVDPGDWRGK